MVSPSRSRATKRRRSSITELAFHGIHTSRRTKAESVTHVSGTFCHLCLGPLTKKADREAQDHAVARGDDDAEAQSYPVAFALPLNEYRA
jgi:hypothetical protein